MEKYNKISAIIIGFILFLLIVLYFSLNFKRHVSVAGFFIVFTMYTAAFLAIRKEGNRYILEFRNYFNGRHAEYAVCKELEKLSDEYSIYRNVKLGNYGDIDLVATGPTGIFAIEVKSHKGNIYYQNGKLERRFKLFEKNFITQAKAGAYNLKKYLSQTEELNELFVNAVLVFSDERANLCFSSDVAPQLQIIKKNFINNVIVDNDIKISEESLLLINKKISEII